MKVVTAGQQVVSASGALIADALVRAYKSLRNQPELRHVVYDPAKFVAARERASSLVERAAGAVGTTTLNRADLEQLLIGGLNALYRIAINVRVASYIQGAWYREYERQAQQFGIEMAQELSRLAEQLRATEQPSVPQRGHGVLLIGIALVALGAYLLLVDRGEALARDLCAQHPDSEACRLAIANYQANLQNPSDPFSSAIESTTQTVQTVIKWVAGIAIAGGVGYLLWVFGPALVGGGRRIRRRLSARAPEGAA